MIANDPNNARVDLAIAERAGPQRDRRAASGVFVKEIVMLPPHGLQLPERHHAHDSRGVAHNPVPYRRPVHQGCDGIAVPLAGLANDVQDGGLFSGVLLENTGIRRSWVWHSLPPIVQDELPGDRSVVNGRAAPESSPSSTARSARAKSRANL